MKKLLILLSLLIIIPFANAIVWGDDSSSITIPGNNSANEITNYNLYYILGAILAVLILIMIYYYFYVKKKKGRKFRRK